MRHKFARFIFGCATLALLMPAASVQATTLSASIWADEPFEVYLSYSEKVPGTRFIEGSGGVEATATAEVELLEGIPQYLHIRVENLDAGPSALIGTLSLSDTDYAFGNSDTLGPGPYALSTNADYWRVSRQGFGGVYEPVVNLGLNGTAPWGTQTDVDPVMSNYIWTDSGSGHHYFSVVIIPHDITPRRFVVAYQPIRNSAENSINLTKNLPRQLNIKDGNTRALPIADPGRVGTFVEEYIDQETGDFYTSTSSESELFDFIVSSEGGETTVDLSLNYLLKGEIIGGAGLGGLPVEKSISSSKIEVYVWVNNSLHHFGQATVTARHEVGTETPGTELTKLEIGNLFGLLSDDLSGEAGDFVTEYAVTYDHTFTTPVTTVPVGEPFTVKLSLVVISTATTDVGRALSTIQFSGGLSYPTEGDVFNLPDGVAINSVYASVRDNQFEPPVESGSNNSEKILVPGLFMRAGDIAGESRAEGREDWTDLLEVSSGLFRLAEGRNRQAALHDDVKLTKHIDKSSPKLAEALAQGKVLEEVIIEHNQKVSEDLWKRFEFRLANAQVTEFQISGQSSESQPIESVSLNYEKIDWIYELCDSQGVGQSRVEANWDLVTNTGGSSSTSGDNQPPSMEPVGNQSVNVASTASINLVIADSETAEEDLEVSVSTSRPDLIGDLELTGTGANRQLSFKTSALRSGFASITVRVSDGTDFRTSSIPVLIDVDMTPYEGYMAAYFDEEERNDLFLTSPIGDPDNDNIPTVVEFVLGTNPREANRPSEAIEVTFNLDGENCHCTLNFNKRLDDPNVQGYFWVSNNMKDWTRMDQANPLYEESVTEGQNPLFGRATATIAFPDVCKEPKFIRFQVKDVF